MAGFTTIKLLTIIDVPYLQDGTTPSIYHEIVFTINGDTYEMIPQGNVILNDGEFNWSASKAGIANNIYEAINNYSGGRSNEYYATFGSETVQIIPNETYGTPDLQPSAYLEFDDNVEIGERSDFYVIDPLGGSGNSINGIYITEAESNKQTNVRYNFEVVDPSYPFTIFISPNDILNQKTVNNISEQWIEYNRFPLIRQNLVVSDVSGSDSSNMFRVNLFEIDFININETTNGGDIQIIGNILETTVEGGTIYDNDLTPNLYFSIDNINWQPADTGLVSSFNNVAPGDYTAYIKDQFGRVVNETFTINNIQPPEVIQYNIRFKIEGNKPPFNVDLKLASNNNVLNTKTVNQANITQSFEDVSANTEYYLFVTDSIGNTFEYYNILYTPQSDTPPYVTNINVNGDLVVNETLNGTYTYNDDDGDVESGSLFKWYRSDDMSGTNKLEISGEISQNYQLTNNDVGKYIQFGVTPVNAKATGDEFTSNIIGPVESEIIPEIINFVGNNTNTLTWVMSDGTESSSTWSVEYSLDNNTWNNSAGGGSPRVGVLPVDVYEQTIYFRVKRVSTPVTEYSSIYSTYVKQITNLNNNVTNPSQVVDAQTYSTTPPAGICNTGNQYTYGYIYIDTTIPDVGTKLYFKGEDGYYYLATETNIATHPSYGLNNILTTIGWIRFSNYTNNDDVWDVDPVTATLTSIYGTCPL
jgi:hypothetical protein